MLITHLNIEHNGTVKESICDQQSLSQEWKKKSKFQKYVKYKSIHSANKKMVIKQITHFPKMILLKSYKYLVDFF